MEPSFLDRNTFVEVVRHAPLVSIDLLVFNAQREVLLGWRANQPAQHSWFVPGGRIRKGERLKDAFRRTLRDELGMQREIESARAAGVYEHFYDENFTGSGGFGTHYVVLAYAIDAPTLNLAAVPASQHHNYRWWEIPDALRERDVHPHVKAYFETANRLDPGNLL